MDALIIQSRTIRIYRISHLKHLISLSEAQASCKASIAASRATSLCFITSCSVNKTNSPRLFIWRLSNYLSLIRCSTFPSLAKLEGRESHATLVSAPLLSSTKLHIGNRHEASLHLTFEAGILLLLGLLNNFLAELACLLLLETLRLSSELSYFTERTGETCLYKKITN